MPPLSPSFLPVTAEHMQQLQETVGKQQFISAVCVRQPLTYITSTEAPLYVKLGPNHVHVGLTPKKWAIPEDKRANQHRAPLSRVYWHSSRDL